MGYQQARLMSLMDTILAREKKVNEPPIKHLVLGDVGGYGVQSWCGFSGLTNDEKTDRMEVVTCKTCLETVITVGEMAYQRYDVLARDKK